MDERRNGVRKRFPNLTRAGCWLLPIIPQARARSGFRALYRFLGTGNWRIQNRKWSPDPVSEVGYSLSSIELEALSDEEISLLIRDHWSAIQNLDCLPALARSHGVLMRYTRVG